QNLDTGLLSYAGSSSVVRREHDNGDAFCFELLEITHIDTHRLHSLPSRDLHPTAPLEPAACIGIPTNLPRGCQEDDGSGCYRRPLLPTLRCLLEGIGQLQNPEFILMSSNNLHTDW